jgi:DNA-directed RNA polymerase subunit RPC12/RpoP
MTEYEVQCASCGAPGVGPDAVRLDLDVSAVPPEHLCTRCRRKPRCSRCGKRRNRLTLQPGSRVSLCGPCIRDSARLEAERCRRTCTACGGPTSVERTNEHGECQDCSARWLYREHPIVRSAS